MGKGERARAASAVSGLFDLGARLTRILTRANRKPPDLDAGSGTAPNGLTPWDLSLISHGARRRLAIRPSNHPRRLALPVPVLGCPGHRGPTDAAQRTTAAFE